MTSYKRDIYSEEPSAPSRVGRVENEKGSVVTTHCRGDSNYQEWHSPCLEKKKKKSH